MKKVMKKVEKKQIKKTHPKIIITALIALICIGLAFWEPVFILPAERLSARARVFHHGGTKTYASGAGGGDAQTLWAYRPDRRYRAGGAGDAAGTESVRAVLGHRRDGASLPPSGKTAAGNADDAHVGQ